MYLFLNINDTFLFNIQNTDRLKLLLTGTNTLITNSCATKLNGFICIDCFD